MTIAPTGSGKGRGCVIPTLLEYPGSVIVFDPKGENVAITGRRREAFGRVVVLDPFGITGRKADALNPLDLIDTDSDECEADTHMLAEAIVPTMPGIKDPFWNDMARQLLAGMILYSCTDLPGLRTLSDLRCILAASRAELDVFLKKMRTARARVVRDAAGSILMAEPRVSASIVSTAQSHTIMATGKSVRQATSTSTFDLATLTAGELVTVYIVIPPERISSQRNLLRLWISALMTAIYRRRHRPDLSTLLLIDEAAQLGSLNLLRDSITLMRGYGLQTWTFWQDFSQLRQLYPRDWETLINNADVLQIFGMRNRRMARQAAELIGFDEPDRLLRLDRGFALTARAHRPPAILRQPDYLKDRRYRGLYDPNPYFERGHGPLEVDDAPPYPPDDPVEIDLRAA